MPPSQEMPTSASVPQAHAMPLTMPASAPRTGAATAPTHDFGPFVVATDGTDASQSVLTMAALLAGADDVEVVGVVEPSPVMMPPAEVPIESAEADEVRAQALWHRLSRQAADVFGAHSPKLRIMIGQPVEMLARAVRERKARMVITGLRHHGLLERAMLHRETPIGVARAARVPVLVVPRGMTALPKTVLVAADAGSASVNAARRARPLLARATKVYVIHVSGGGSEPDQHGTMSGHAHDHSAQHTFDRILAAMALPPSVSVETRLIPGAPVDELLDFAEFARVDLTVAGYHPRLAIERLVSPRSVAERVFRGTTCAMLLVPAIAGAEMPFGADAEHEVVADREEWPRVLASFSGRDAGRPVQLDIDTPGNGGQAQLRGCRLLGCALNDSGEGIRLLLGGADGAVLQFTHDIANAESLDVQRDSEGRDLALRVAHDGGYTLLTFHDAKG